VAQAYRVDVTPARIVFTFLPTQRVAREQCEDSRPWLEGLAEKAFGRKVPVSVSVADSGAGDTAAASAAKPRGGAAEAAGPSEEELRAEAMADPTAQALFEIFPVEKSKVEEI